MNYIHLFIIPWTLPSKWNTSGSIATVLFSLIIQTSIPNTAAFSIFWMYTYNVDLIIYFINKSKPKLCEFTSNSVWCWGALKLQLWWSYCLTKPSCYALTFNPRHLKNSARSTPSKSLFSGDIDSEYCFATVLFPCQLDQLAHTGFLQSVAVAWIPWAKGSFFLCHMS